MTNRVKISVGVEHIEAGQPNAPTSCPVALAISEQLPGIPTPAVYGTVVTFYKNGVCSGAVRAPLSVQRFVRAVDKGKVVRPFNFLLEVPF